MAKNQYSLTEAQIEAMAAERTQSLNVTEAFDGTYLKVLITRVQGVLGTKRGKRMGTDVQLTALHKEAAPCYAAVLRGVMTPDIALDASLEADEVRRRTTERNRRATFARTAKSTLVAWVMEGGDLRALEVATVTKTELRTAVAAARAEHGVPAASRIERAQNAILAVVAREGPDRAREHLEAVMEALQQALDALPSEPDHAESAVIRTRVGVPSFREPARVLNRGA